MISICVPVYNYDCTPLLDQLVDQVSRLSIAYEIIVFNDASQQRFKPYDSSMVQTINSEKNIGRSAAREQLAKHATYENLIFLDADVRLPDNNFLNRYIDCISRNYDIVYGGVSYSNSPPESAYLLRWLYGKKRESRSVEKRKEDRVQNLISMGFMIKKELFLKISSLINGNFYGHDIVFSYHINSLKYKITHIDNPVIHLGLETAIAYLYKSIEAINTTYQSEKSGLISNDFRPVQRAYLKIKKTGALKLFLKVIEKRRTALDKNLVSSKAKLIYLDFIKLYHYSQLKQKD
ncbi:MAG: glycosyltransferase family 2 protein [Nonlabens sp.]|uniref:glycosyltransferase family 2 protein n=1 Tax=Nonlabens sp. TaxID=1888209 RepID=UPI003EF8346D